MLRLSTMKDPKSLGHIRETLTTRRASIQAQIEEEMKRPLPDMLSISILKRERLRLKDDLTLIDGVLRSISRPLTPDAA